MMSVYFFIANTSKVESNKMMQMSLRTFIIKVFIFIIIAYFREEIMIILLTSAKKKKDFEKTIISRKRFAGKLAGFVDCSCREKYSYV